MTNTNDDNVSNSSDNESFDDVIAARLSRRRFLGGGLATAAAASLGGVGALLNAVPVSATPKRGSLLGFQGLPVSASDSVVVPPGYTAKVLIAWGDPVSEGPAFRPDAGNSAEEQAQQWGMHNDGLAYFPLNGSARGLLVQNNEYTDDVLLFPDGLASWNAEKTKKSLNVTPWRTYLACEENFNGYFRKTAAPTPMERRYGITAAGFGYLWHTTDARFQVDGEPNEPNRFGWVVEIDPFDPTSTPVKRTALGRFKHEGAWVQEARDGRIVVYSGDDEQFEYIYRYVSNLKWREARRRGVSPLDDGILYVARFNADGTGEWLPLTPDNPSLAGWSRNDILINTRGAADAAGATKMDRPEWIDTFPESLTAIATLTNNSRRGTGTNAPTDAANPRAANVYGHVIQWSYGIDWTEPTFTWDIFVLAGDPANPAHGSTIVGDKYGSPDGIYVAPSGRLWIQTDVSGSTLNSGAYAGFGNNQMLCADPTTRETRRFLVGPNVCEVTGVVVTPDETTMFVGIQHPGEAPTGANDPANPKRYSSWPDGATGGRPRSACVVITKDDGGPIGS